MKLEAVPDVMYKPRKLDIGCGQNRMPGFKGIDLADGVDIHHDLFSFPWPIQDNCVNEVVCNHFLEHVPHYRPDWDGVDGWWMFWAEVYRICRDEATLTFRHPYVWNDRAFQDPTHVRFIHESNYWYLTTAFREANKLDHYAPDVEFETITVSYSQPPEIANRNDAARGFAQAFWKNAIGDLEVILKCHKS